MLRALLLFCRGRRIRHVVPLLVVVLAGLTTACTDFQKPRWDASEKRLFAVPFRELNARNRDWYYWSQNGADVVAHFKSWVENNWVSNIVDDSVGPGFQRKIRRWTGDLTPKNWGELTVGAPFDIILVGEIETLSLKQPGDVNLLRGSATMRYSIYEAGTGRRLYFSGRRDVRFPKQQEFEIPTSILEFDKEPWIRRNLLKSLGELIGKDLYGYVRH